MTAKAWRRKMSSDDNLVDTKHWGREKDQNYTWMNTHIHFILLYSYYYTVKPELILMPSENQTTWEIFLVNLPTHIHTKSANTHAHTHTVIDLCWCSVQGADRCFMSELLFTLSGFHFHPHRDRAHRSFLSVLTHLTAPRSQREEQEEEGVVLFSYSHYAHKFFHLLSF